jgi:surface polysaccharide O-acyltransferase-like enzyme
MAWEAWLQNELLESEEGTVRTNYAAVIVSAIVYFLLGYLWFGVLFNKPWMALEHFTEGQLQGMNPVPLYVISFLLNLLIAFVLAQICIWRNANTAARGASMGVLMWIGFVGPVTYATYMYELRPKELFAINEFYPLVGFCLMGAILGAWKKKAA